MRLGGLQLRQEAWPFYVKHISMAWAQEKNARESRRKTWTKKQCPSFDQHVSELQDRLARHGCETDLVPSHDPRHQPVVLEQIQRAEADVEEANEQISKIKQVSKSGPWCSMISRKEKNALRGRWVGILKAAETRQRGARKALSKIDAFFGSQQSSHRV